MRAYALILERLYGIHQGLDSPLIRVVTDPESGLERYFQITPDFQFVQVATNGSPPEMSKEVRRMALPCFHFFESRRKARNFNFFREEPAPGSVRG